MQMPPLPPRRHGLWLAQVGTIIPLLPFISLAVIPAHPCTAPHHAQDSMHTQTRAGGVHCVTQRTRISTPARSDGDAYYIEASVLTEAEHLHRAQHIVAPAGKENELDSRLAWQLAFAFAYLEHPSSPSPSLFTSASASHPPPSSSTYIPVRAKREDWMVDGGRPRRAPRPLRLRLPSSSALP
ncbi:hypothetical protein B0H11DRAFT_2264899 [Mycena galericulata]|nr:hypothetical protein B0H11DRAFT_2264899 [Mycena galericulata]